MIKSPAMVARFLFIILMLFAGMARANPSRFASEVSGLLNPRLEQIRKSRMVYAWQVASPRDRLPYYCVDQCACLVREFAKELQKNSIPFQVVSVNMIPRKDYEVRLHTHKGRSESYSYHKAIAVQINGVAHIIDPIAIGSAKPEPFTKWQTRIERLDKKIISFSN